MKWFSGARRSGNRLLGAALLAAVTGLAGCGAKPPNPDEITSQRMQELLVFEAFGEATLTTDLNTVKVSATGASEAGMFIRTAESAAEPVIVRFKVNAPAPLNLRLTRGEGFDYRSTATDSYFIIGPGQASEALLYGASPLDIKVEVEALIDCEGGDYSCLADGSVAYLPRLNGIEGRLIAAPYQAANLATQDNARLTISPSGTGSEYGVFLSTPAAEDTRFILSFDAAPNPNTVTLRVGTEPDVAYFTASRGWTPISNTPQVLLYSADPSGFSISNVKIAPCSAEDWRCKTAERFYELLPGEAGDTSLNRAIRITEWVSKNADFALSPSIAQSMDLNGLTPDQVFHRYYEPSTGGGFCGATAHFLAQTLRSQGFDAFTLDFGLSESELTHVTTILALDGKFYMLDATFGAILANPKTDKALDLLSVLDGAPFKFAALNMQGRDFLVAEINGSWGGWLEDGRRDDVLTDCIKHGDTLDFEVCKGPSFGLEAYLDIFSEQIAAENLDATPDVLIRLMRRNIYNIGAPQDTDSMRAFAKALSERGLNFAESPGQISATRLLD